MLGFGIRPEIVHAECFGELQGEDGAFSARINGDPKGVVAQVRASLDQGATPNQPAAPTGATPTRAHLYAILADAEWLAGDITAAREAIAAGTDALSTADSDALRRRLKFASLWLSSEQGQLERATAELERAAPTAPMDVPDYICVLTYRGYLRFRNGRIADAAADLMTAARLAKARGSDKFRVQANSVLSMLYAKYGLTEEALALADEAMSYYLPLNDKIGLSDAHFRRGDAFRNRGDYGPAEVEFVTSRDLALAAGDRLDAETAQERLCRTLSKTTKLADARVACSEAHAQANTLGDPEADKYVLAAEAAIELADGHPKDALPLLNRALAHDGVDLPQRSEAEFHGLRGQVYARLGDDANALQDTNVFLTWLKSDTTVKSVAQVSVLRLRYDAVLTEEEMARLRAEAATAKLTAARRTLEMNEMALSAALLLSTGVFAVWLRRRRLETERVGRTAQERMAAMAQVTGGIAHDFNNQLTVMEQAIWLLSSRSSVSSDAAAADLVKQILQAGRACAEITTQMISFARQQNLKREAIEMAAILAELKPKLAALAGPAVTLEFNVERPEAIAWADRAQLTAALLNLVGNARDAMAGGGTISITASRESAETMLVAVTDEGCGMTAEVLARAAEPFFSTKPVGRGSGLGLSMVQGFAAQSGGSLSIVSEPGKGTTVSLRLPACGSSHA